MAKTPNGKKHTRKLYSAYKPEGGKLARTKRSCPKCGQGSFMAKHKDRESCGKCGYTEFKKKE